MNVVLIVLVLMAGIVFISLIKTKVHRKKIHVTRKNRSVLINDVEVEYADLQHYIDTQKEFENRKNVVDLILEPVIDIVENQVNVEVPTIVNHHINEDVQNVHDNLIQKNIKGVYSNISKTQQPFYKEDILDYIQDEEKLYKISGILDKIEIRNAYVTNLNSDEVDVIKNVWFSGDDNVKAQVINELLDCVDKQGTLYCPTGVTSRISSALHINSPENAPKTKEILNQEVMTTFGKHYTEIPDKSLAKQKTVDEYYQIYPRETIEDLINQWIDYL